MDEIDEFILSGQWLYTASSNVQAWHYLAEQQILEVEFLDNSVYQYYKVPFDVAKRFYLTDSPGRFVWNHLRDKYDYTQVMAGSGKRKGPQVVRLVPD